MIVETKSSKRYKSENYNYLFNKNNGFFARWGGTIDDDPEFAPSPEIADIEITSICNAGSKNGSKPKCNLCYKSNTSKGINMSFETFKKIFNSLPKSLTQIAFGVDYDATSNPDLIKMMKYSRDNGVIPNLTVAELSNETATEIVKYAGAVAVSQYFNKEKIKKFYKRLK